LSQVKHDTLNPTALSRERNYGPYKTSSLLAHAPPKGAPALPRHVHRPAMKEEFFRKTNVSRLALQALHLLCAVVDL
jgi:hypothetical protein